MTPENSDAGRLQLLLQATGLALTLATAAGVTYVNKELAETRILIMEKISQATENLVRRHEFDALERRLSNVENQERKR